MPHVYYLKNRVNGKMYVGFTGRDDPQKRIQEHFNPCCVERNARKPLYRAIKKYGVDCWETGVLFSHDNYEETLQKEIELIEVFHSEYNLSPGGNVPPGDKRKYWKPHITEEHKAKLRKPKPPRTKEHIENLSAALKGKPSPRKGIPTGRPGWNKGRRTSGNVSTWTIVRAGHEPEIVENLVFWCEQNGYEANAVKGRYYKGTLPYMDILEITKVARRS